MENLPRPNKDTTRAFIVEVAPLYTEMFRDIQLGTWRGFPRAILTICNNLKIHNYVGLYDGERRIGAALALGVLGPDTLREVDTELSKLTYQEQCDYLDGLTTEIMHLDLENALPKTEVERKALREWFQQLPDVEKQEVIKHGQWFWNGVFSYFYNTLSLMIHGAKLTCLVQQAMQGCPDAFAKAIQVDRLLLSHHPYFIQRRFDAYERNDLKLLTKIAYRERSPVIRGKIRYPGLYMVFACLDATNHLDDFTHAEILDMCDEARLDRYQNAIQDVNYVTKRFREYRRKQKGGELSMH